MQLSVSQPWQICQKYDSQNAKSSSISWNAYWLWASKWNKNVYVANWKKLVFFVAAILDENYIHAIMIAERLLIFYNTSKMAWIISLNFPLKSFVYYMHVDDRNGKGLLVKNLLIAV